MKKKCIWNILIYIFCFLFPSGKIDAAPFTLIGTVHNAEADSLDVIFTYNMYENNRLVEHSASAKVSGGKFQFRGDIPEAVGAFMEFSNKVCFYFYIEPAQMSISIDMEHPLRYRLDGAEIEDENKALSKETLKYREAIQICNMELVGLIEEYNALEEGDSRWDVLWDSISAVRDARDSIGAICDSIELDFVMRHPAYKINPDRLYKLAKNEYIDVNHVRAAYDKLPLSSRHSMMGQIALKEIKDQSLKKMTKLGAVPPDFIRKAYAGDSIRLSGYRGQYVLLDFWASWCGPCLKSMPHVKELVRQYGGKGLSVIGISVDYNAANWRNAIVKHGLAAWPHVLGKEPLDSDKPEDDLSYLYSCDAVPFYVLLDRNGRVLAKWQYLGESEVEEIRILLREGMSGHIEGTDNKKT